MMRATKVHDIIIEGIGAVTSLGLDVETSCAAARAGLRRTQLQETYPVVAPDEMDLQELAAHEVPFVTRGFEGRARLGRLLEAALVDLRNKLPHIANDATSLHFYLAIPHPDQLESGKALQYEEHEAENDLNKNPLAEERQSVTRQNSGWLSQVAKRAGWSGDARLQHVSAAGHASIAELLIIAANDLTQYDDRHAIIASADSFVDTSTLAWLHACGRLKEPMNASGVPAGEGGVAVCVTKKKNIPCGMRPPVARLDAIAIGQEINTLLSGGHSDGKVLSDVIAAVQEVGEVTKKVRPWFISDLNGEAYRAIEWAGANLALINRFPLSRNAPVWSLASSLGDTGCASAGIAIAAACEAFARDYAPSDCAMVISSSQGAGRSAILLSKVD